MDNLKQDTQKIKFEMWNKYEGYKVRPAVISSGMQINLDNELEIKCNIKRSQLENKLIIVDIIGYLISKGYKFEDLVEDKING